MHTKVSTAGCDADGAYLLVVEDSITQAEELRHSLEKAGYSVEVAVTGEKALDRMRQKLPVVVISDVLMPGMDGYKLCKQIRSDNGMAAVPVILLTSLSDPVDVIRGLECGANNFLHKPYDRNYLFYQIQQLVSNAELRKTSQVENAIKVHFGDHDYVVTAERMQILDLLLSTYEHSYRQNQELIRVRDELKGMNQKLESRVEERTAALRREVTERKRAENLARNAYLELEQIFNCSAEGMRVIDYDRRIIRINDRFAQLSGISAEDAVGKRCYEIFPGTDCQTSTCMLTRVLNGDNPVYSEVVKENHQGKMIPCLATGSLLLDHDGNVVGLVESFKDLTEWKRLEQQVAFLANYDPLTRLPNRVLLTDRLNMAVSAAQRSRRQLGVLMLSIDKFKKINDSLGHAAGDKLLQAVSLRLVATLRETDTIARMGGDDFAIVLSEIRDSQYLLQVAQKIIAAFTMPFEIGGTELFISVSIGIASFPGDGESREILLRSADSALNQAKKRGGNGYSCFAPSLNSMAMERLTLEMNLRRALSKDEFFLEYQPQVDLESGQIVGVEALIRWRHPELGIVPPDSFIPLAEESGSIIPIGEWVLRTACTQIRSWQERAFPPLKVAVNISLRQLDDDDLVTAVSTVLAETGLAPPLLELEITESTIMHDPVAATRIFTRLKEIGISLAIDDFGTGYSSLSYLRRFPLDRIKIDRSFVRELPCNADDAVIVRTIIDMAHNLNLLVVCEGVETLEQLNFMRRYRCDEVQGYYFSCPAAATEIARMLHVEPPEQASRWRERVHRWDQS